MKESIKVKIAKLLALAESPNEHEAMAAFTKARELMAEYKIGESEVVSTEKREAIRHLTQITCSKRRHAWAPRLSAVIAEHFCCKSYRTRLRGKQTVTIGLIGFKEDIAVVETMLTYAYNFVAAECVKIRKKLSSNHSSSELTRISDAYGDGFCSGLLSAFKQQQAEHQEYGLVLVTPPEVQAIYVGMGKSKSFKQMLMDAEAEQYKHTGFQDGSKFKLTSGVLPNIDYS